tara:strand:- start:75 stop:236 length:162 start_codon:yes stop_codon:yes gene_type:complete
MIENILELLSQKDWIGYSENIDIAKGKYKIPRTVKEEIEQVKRENVWQIESKR